MSEKNIILNEKMINKINFYKSKKLFKIDDTDANKVLVSKQEPYGENKSIKYFIVYNGDDVIRSFCTKHPQMIGYGKYCDSNKTTDKKLLKSIPKYG